VVVLGTQVLRLYRAVQGVVELRLHLEQQAVLALLDKDLQVGLEMVLPFIEAVQAVELLLLERLEPLVL
jgi:hypothetical protein